MHAVEVDLRRKAEAISRTDDEARVVIVVAGDENIPRTMTGSNLRRQPGARLRRLLGMLECGKHAESSDEPEDEAKKISGDYGGALVIVIIGGENDVKAGFSSLDLGLCKRVGILEAAKQIESLKDLWPPRPVDWSSWRSWQ
jgi:hypothetical protein